MNFNKNNCLAKIHIVRPPFIEDGVEVSTRTDIKTLTGAIELLIGTEEASGLCVAFDSTYYAFIVIELDRIAANRWLLWNSITEKACMYLRCRSRLPGPLLPPLSPIAGLTAPDDPVSLNSLPATKGNTIPVLRRVILHGAVPFTTEGTPSEHLAYGMLTKDGTQIFFSYPIWTRKRTRVTKLHPLLPSALRKDSSLPLAQAVHYTVNVLHSHQRIEVLVAKLSDCATINDAWPDDQYVYAFREIMAADKSADVVVQTPPDELCRTWFWSALSNGPGQCASAPEVLRVTYPASFI